VTKRGLLLGALAALVFGLAASSLAHVRQGRATDRLRHPTWAAVGDSITFGMGSSDPDTNAYPVLAGVASHGLPGQCLVAPRCEGRPLVEALPGELTHLQEAGGVEAVVVEIGINDLGQVTDQQYVDAYSRLRTEGARQGVRVVLSTITPFGPAHAFSPAEEQQRERVNAWIRSQGTYVDFDAALRSGLRLSSQFDSGDGMHPGDAGHACMAQVLDSWIAQNT
jgi:lysophospholipase L1-like esterase